MKPLKDFIRRHPNWVALLGATLVYVLCCSYYMGDAFLKCSTYLTSGPGDQTAGLIWLNSVDGSSPFWGFTKVTNYPFGEQLGQPVHISGGLLYLVYWLLAGATGSVCGYNLLNAIGFISAAVVMFGFINWLTRKPWIALLAGYAVSFTPYLQIKTSVHPSYVYQGLLIGILWLFVSFWLKPRLVPAIGIAVLTAASFYVDPYFVLLVGVLLVGLLGTGIVYDALQKPRWPNLKIKLKYAAASVGVAALLLTPLVYTRLHYANQINSFVSNSRNGIRFDAQIYSAHVMEYFRPNEFQPVLHWLNPLYATHRDRHSSNAAEYTINLSLGLLGVILVAGGLYGWRWYYRKRRDDIPLRAPVQFIVPVVVVVGLLAFIFSLAPMTHGYKMPTWYLTAVITMWRVFARLFVVVNIAFVTLAAVALAYLATRMTSRWLKAIGLLLLAAVVAFEYQTFVPPRPVWSYERDVAAVYHRLHERKDIQVIAEYSLDEQPVTAMPTFYLTYQRVHGKKMINGDLPGSPQAPIRGSIRSLDDPQSIPALRALGADAIVVHGAVGNPAPDQLELVDYQAAESKDSNPNFQDPANLYPIAIYKIKPGPKEREVIAPVKGFIPPRMLTSVSYNYIGGNESTLQLYDLPGSSDKRGLACFSIRAEKGQPITAAMKQNGRVLWSGTLTAADQRIQFEANTGQPIMVTESSRSKISFSLDDLGCDE